MSQAPPSRGRRSPAPVERIAAMYLAVQGLGGLAWWLLLLIRPETRPLFTATAAPVSTLLAFAPGDLVLYAGGSLAAAFGLWTGRTWAWPACGLHAGAAVYAALYCLTLWLLDPRTWLPAVMMLPSLIVPPAIVWTLRPGQDRSC